METLSYSILISDGQAPGTLSLQLFCNDNDCGIDGEDNVRPDDVGNTMFELCARNDMLPSELTEVWGGDDDSSIKTIRKLNKQVRNGAYDRKHNLTEIVEHYLQAAAWSTSGGDYVDGNPEHESLEAFDFSEAACIKARKDCQAFVAAAGSLLDGIDDEMIGHDFWLTREHHGVGFWDRGYGERGDKLTDLSDTFGNGDLYLGDDGYLHFMGQ